MECEKTTLVTLVTLLVLQESRAELQNIKKDSRSQRSCKQVVPVSLCQISPTEKAKKNTEIILSLWF